MSKYPLYDKLVSQQNNSQPEISSAEAGINTLEDLMNMGSGSYSRSDPTLWSINGQQVRIDPKLYQDYADYNQAWRYSDIYQKYGIKESVQYKDEWTKNYLENYNTGTLSPHPQGSSTMNKPQTTQPTPTPTATPTAGQSMGGFANSLQLSNQPFNTMKGTLSPEEKIWRGKHSWE